MDGWTGGLMVGCADGWMDRRLVSLLLTSIYSAVHRNVWYLLKVLKCNGSPILR
jgi:hypothetical protein